MRALFSASAVKDFVADGDDKKKETPKFDACCSPDCDWLLEYLEIDGTVVKCID